MFVSSSVFCQMELYGIGFYSRLWLDVSWMYGDVTLSGTLSVSVVVGLESVNPIHHPQGH